MFIIWVISVLITVFIARDKNRSLAGWFLLSLIFGPVALIIVLLLSKAEQKQARIPYQDSGLSLGSIKADLEDLKNEFSALNNRLNNLAKKINILEPKPHSLTKEEALIKREEREEPQPAVSITHKSEEPANRKPDIEMNLGRFWLNKIGMVVFSLGIAFLLSYTFTRLGPVAKILLGYLIAVVLFISGMKLEKMEKFVNYGRVLLGGGWAIVYFTTYAMHNFEASKIIESQLLDLFFLGIVAAGIIAHSLRYKSEALTALALFIGYFTSALGDVGYFTLISAALLAAAALVVVYKMQWVKFIFLGIVLTYVTHFVWIIKQISFSRIPVSSLNVENICFHFDSGFLSIYWLLFTAAIHLIKIKEAGAVYKKLAAANFSNFLLFFFMAYPKFYFFYPAHKFNVILGFGLAYMILAVVMELIKKNELFISDIVIAVSLLTLSVPLRFLPYHTTIIWFTELPFLLFIGFTFKRTVYRYLGFALSAVLFLKLIFLDWYLLGSVQFFAVRISWQALLSFMGFVSTAGCFALCRFFEGKKDTARPEKILRNFYSGFSVVYLTMYMWEVVKPLWLTLGLSLESLAIFTLGVLLLDKYIRWYALAILALAGVRFCFYGGYRGISELQQTFLIYGPIACAFAEYFIYRRINRKALILNTEARLAKILFFAAASLLIFAIVVYMRQAWITLGLVITALLALLWGAKISDKYIRVYALLVLASAAFRFSFVDNYYGFAKFFQWSLIGLKLSGVYTAYFIYRALDKKAKLDKSEESLISPIFYISSLLAVLAIFKYIKDTWISVALGILGVFLFVIGFLIRDKIFRHGGFIIFGITLVRVVFVDLAGLAIIYKIFSFIILGILFLGVSFIYTKYTNERLR